MALGAHFIEINFKTALAFNIKGCDNQLVMSFTGAGEESGGLRCRMFATPEQCNIW